jgi:hypothetical protein
MSSSLTVKGGIPQCSVFWSITFLLHRNYVLHLTKGRTIMYANGASILNTGKDINEVPKTTPDD